MKQVTNINELTELLQMVTDGFISVRQHPTAPLRIYNYTAKAQYENVWNVATRTCRGLIADEQGEVVARPFSKFFNLEQVAQLPNEPFEVYEKLDGSLGILYWIDDEPYIATRGSFESPQAQIATQLLQTYDPSGLDRRCTYLFEIIYPENRIVVDYGKRRELVLLAIIDTTTGKEHPVQDLGFPVATKHDGITDVDSLQTLEWDNREGVVVRFAGGLRVKVKCSEYVRLHRLLTGVTEKMILEDYLRTGADMTSLLERVPDEFNAWLQQTVQHFRAQYDAIEQAAKQIFAATTATTRKDCAAVFAQTPYSAILFRMLDQREYTQLIWKQISANPRTFKVDNDE
jgi:RNA ligase